jgi:hypothetical protein
LTDCKSCERMASAETKIENLEAATGSMEKKVDGLKNWIIGLLGTSVLSLILLVANLVSKGGDH